MERSFICDGMILGSEEAETSLQRVEREISRKMADDFSFAQFNRTVLVVNLSSGLRLGFV